MSKKIRVLVFPCGAENALEIHDALKDCVNIEVYGATSVNDHGEFVFRNYIGNLPFISKPDFISIFNTILEKNCIDIVFPTHDDVSLFFAEHQSEIKAKLALPGLNQSRICRYKKLTYEALREYDFCPVVHHTPESIGEFPVFVKPNVGQGSNFAQVVKNFDRDFLETAFKNDFVVTEYLPGDEYTVDCFSDRHFALRFVGPRKRSRVSAGISRNSFTVPLNSEIENIAIKINEKLKMRGLWYFQIKQDKNGKLKLLEVSVRAAGTMNLYRCLGVNFPLLTVYDLLDLEVEIMKNENYLEVDRALFNMYKSDLEYETVYIDFDDTITKDGLVNPMVMLFLYNAKNRGKKIHLITRHEFSLSETLNRLGIHPGIFDKIDHIKIEENKADYISEVKSSIFIDNAYKDRKVVKDRHGIPVFDVDAIISLIDWRY